MLKNMPEGLLERLESMANPRESLLRNAKWLRSQFSDKKWNISFGSHDQTVDWSVRFGSGLLTDPPHEKMLEAFKMIVTSQGHPAAMRGRVIDDRTTKRLVYRGFRFVDFFLLQKDTFKLAKYGFDLVTDNDFDQLLFRCVAGPSDEQVIYGWNDRLASWLDERVSEHREEVESLLSRHEVFNDIPIPPDEWSLKCNEDQLASWRAVLWVMNMYRPTTASEYRYIPFIAKLAGEIYKDTIFGKGRKTIHDELCLYPAERYWREHPGVDVRTISRDKSSWKYVEGWKSAILSLSTLESSGVDVPMDAVESLREKDLSRYGANSLGRYRNPPFWQVLDGIKDGVEFALDYGDALLESYVNIARAAKAQKVSFRWIVSSTDIRQYLTKKVLELGVSTFCLRQEARDCSPFQVCKSRWDQGKFFEDLRSGRGLLQDIEVLYGSYISIIGPVTARRQAELLKLPLNGCLDSSRTHMMFRNGKSGAGDLRQEEQRPIPPIVEQLVSQVERFQSQLIEAGEITHFGLLFDIPGFSGMRVPTSPAFNRCLDVFCDYFNTPLDANGRRHYLREHQFRRFLVITFFFAARRGSLETLRWFVGHVDATHLWNYLTNSISGDLRREAAAYFLMDELRLPEEQQVIEVHESVRKELGDLTEAEFGTRKFALVDAEALEDYLNLQMKKGLVVEPVFIPGTGGHEYKIVARIRSPR